jgi:hypothetical protein
MTRSGPNVFEHCHDEWFQALFSPGMIKHPEPRELAMHRRQFGKCTQTVAPFGRPSASRRHGLPA